MRNMRNNYTFTQNLINAKMTFKYENKTVRPWKQTKPSNRCLVRFDMF